MTSATPRNFAIACRHPITLDSQRMKGKASVLAETDGLLLRTFARRCGVYLALAALTLQLMLSFGHVHRHDLASPNLASPNVALSKTVAKIGVPAGSQALTKLKLSKQPPSPLADDDELCSICFSTLLLASSFIPDAPQHSPSSDFVGVDRFFGRTFDLVLGSDHAPFQSRAPPLS
jgi:hypothetical protein